MNFGLGIKSGRRPGQVAMIALLALTLAGCGGGGGNPGTTNANGGTGTGTGTGAGTGTGTGTGTTTPTVTAGAVSLIFSKTELPSAGGTGSDVTVTALVKSGDNNAMADVPVKFVADSGALTGVDAKSDTNGQAKATLSTSGDRTNRRITVTAQAGGKTAVGTIDVVGTAVTITGPSTVTSGMAGDYLVTVKDSAGAPVANVPLSLNSQKGNTISVKTSGGGTATAPLTNSQGQVLLSVAAIKSGADTLSVGGQGANAGINFNVNAALLSLQAVDTAGNVVTLAATNTTCQRIVARYENNGVPQNGSVNITTSRGRLYGDSACTLPLVSSAVPVAAGNSDPVYVKSDTIGIATIAASVLNGPTTEIPLEFVALLTPTSTISLQADPAVIGPNSGTGQSQTATVTAIVRDGTANNNLVKNATVEFSLVTDKSGGRLSSPSVVKTESNGAASVTYIAGTADTETNGVTIQARIQNTATTATTSLTVGRKALYIRAGTGNQLDTPTSTTYKKDYAVFVTDAAGNPVQGVELTSAVIPTWYKTGYYEYINTTGGTSGWSPVVIERCVNEDPSNTGVYDAAKDVNGNGMLDPGNRVAVTTSGTTDASGMATVSLQYPRDVAFWTEVKLTIRGRATGTEGSYSTEFTLSALATDLSSQQIPPPVNPYGVAVCSRKPN